MKEFKLPDLGEGIESGDVVQVHVSEGDTISAEQTVVEVETDKAVLEVPCPFAGKVSKVHVKQGDKASVGDVIVTIEANGEAEDASEEAAPAEEEKPAKKSDEAPKEKAEKPTPAKQAEPEKKTESEEKAAPSKKEKSSEEASDEPVPAGPATRRLARELGVDLEAVARANAGERITEEMVKAFVRGGGSGASSEGGAKPGSSSGGGVSVEAPPLPDFTTWGSVERVRFSSLQRKTAAHMSLGWTLAPHVTQFDDVDVTALEALRKRYRETDRGKEVKLTVTAFVVKALAAALKAYPQFNSSLDAASDELVLKQYYHIGVAVDTPDGLIVPVIRDVDRKGVLDIAGEMNELAERTRQRKVPLDELKGGTFTVTNLGGIGGTAFTPIINYPEVAILGMARSRREPVLKDGELAERIMLPLCLSYDHRVINGADGARFIRKLATLLEDPEMLLLGA